MKEMYVKPMIEKIVFDQDVIADSGNSSTEIPKTNKSRIVEGCTVGKNGKTLKNKNDNC